MNCPFCDPPPDQIVHQTKRIICLWDQYPVSPGHALIIPRRHVDSWFAATPSEQQDISEVLTIVRNMILDQYPADGFNIGINDGSAAGQTVNHLHVHLIPRYDSDVPDPIGGVRCVIPSKANYLKSKPIEAGPLGDTSTQRLVTGGTDALLPHLVRHLQDSDHADMAIAFLRRSGLRLISEHLLEMLKKGGSLRIVTGDYLAITEPEALRQICDWMQHPNYGDRVEARFFQSKHRSFHPKGFLFHHSGRADQSVAIVGSTNLSKMALTEGVEWSYQVYAQHDFVGLTEVTNAFNDLWANPDAIPLNEAVIRGYQSKRKPSDTPAPENTPETLEAPPKPHEIQAEALKALQETRQSGFRAGLVVLATGLGKTWLSAFDSNRPEFKRILFVAHREEILSQAMDTYRRIRPDAHFGFYNGQQHDPHAEIVFASIQTLSRRQHLERFDEEAFDYIVVDEFHHATAQTYRRVIDYFEPKFALGLTATPDRTDSSDLLALCQYNEVYRCGIPRAIKLNLLCPFHYFGVADDVDYRQIPWRNRRFDTESLTRHWATRERAINALEQLQEKAGQKTLAFCCSTVHADFMRDFFIAQNIRAASVHSGPTSNHRAQSLEHLAKGNLDIVFAVDMFNEGIDLPEIDTVLMLRPTESKILWLQQLGRGLRWAEGKVLRVIDYIGNHRSFRIKPEALLQVLVDIDPNPTHLAYRLTELNRGTAQLPQGCEVTYDLESKNILEQIIGRPKGPTAIETYYDDFCTVHGFRPDAAHIHSQGYNLRALTPQTWLQFVIQREPEWHDRQKPWIGGPAGRFAEVLERTPMTKSYKMLVLLSLLDHEAIPGSMSISELTTAFVRIALRSPHWQNDISVNLDDSKAVQRLLIDNPIKAWCGGNSTGGVSFFSYADNIFHCDFNIEEKHRDEFRDWIREIVIWRLADYVDRIKRHADTDQLICRVIQSQGKPFIKLPDHSADRTEPWGWQPVVVNNNRYEANFVKIAVNVIRHIGEEDNVLPDILRDMFGQNAGQRGTRFQIILGREENGEYHLKPLENESKLSKAHHGMSYRRAEIPGLFGLEYTEGSWRQTGVVFKDNHLFLLVTLEKESFEDSFKYKDLFLSEKEFQWQSQNATSQVTKRGQMYRHHEKQGIQVHLFVRPTAKENGKAARFFYCGDLTFIRWNGDKPITIWWRLKTMLPPHLHDRMGLTKSDK